MKKLVALVLALIPVAALAAGETPAQPAWQLPIMLGVFFVIFWFMVWRPQSKRAKEHKNLLSSIGKGDEVVTNAGIAGKVTKVTDDYIQGLACRCTERLCLTRSPQCTRSSWWSRRSR